MDKIRRMNLQLFAGEGAGGGEGAQGAAGPGEGTMQTEEQLPQQRRRSRASEFDNVVFGIQTQDEPETGEQTAAQPDDGANTEQQTQKMSFKDLIRSDEYKAEADEYIQNIVKDRLKGAKAQEALIGRMTPTLERIAQRYNVDASDLNAVDFDKLNAQIDGDEVYLTEKAALNGVTVDVQRQLDEADRIKMSFARQQQELDNRKAFDAILQQAESMRAIVPGFDLQAEMANPVFVQMIRPPQMGGSGLSVEAAYAALHYKDMMGAGMQAAAQQARLSAANNIRAGQQRPAENGSVSSRTVERITDPSKLTKAQRAEIRRRAEAGESISF